MRKMLYFLTFNRNIKFEELRTQPNVNDVYIIMIETYK